MIANLSWSDFWEKIKANWKEFIDAMNNPTGDAYGNGWGSLFGGMALKNPSLGIIVMLQKDVNNLKKEKG